MLIHSVSDSQQLSDIGSPPSENKLPLGRQLFPKEERSAEDEWFVIPPADANKIQPLPPVIKNKTPKRIPTDRLKILNSLLKMSGRSIKKRFKCYLDLGCGNGDIFLTNLEYLNPQQGYCADIHNNNLPRFIQIVNNKIPLPNNSVDLITCHVSIHHFKKPDLMINEMKRIMMPDGYLFIREHDVTSEELNDVTAYLDLLHMMELIRHAKPITREIQTSFYRRYWSKDTLSKLLNLVGFEEIGFQRYIKRYNPQRLYHSLYFFNPSLFHDEITGSLPLTEDAKYSSEKNNLVQWLQSDSKRRFSTKKEDGQIPTINSGISIFSSENKRQPEPGKPHWRRLPDKMVPIAEATVPSLPTRVPTCGFYRKSQAQAALPSVRAELNVSKKKYHDMGERSYYHWFCETLRKKLRLDRKVLENIIKRSKDDLHFYQQIFNLIHPDFDYCSNNPSSSLYLDTPRRYQHGRPRSRSSPNRDSPGASRTKLSSFKSSNNQHLTRQSANRNYVSPNGHFFSQPANNHRYSSRNSAHPKRSHERSFWVPVDSRRRTRESTVQEPSSKHILEDQ